MFTNFSEFINCIVEARFGFKYLYELLLELWSSITANPNIEAICSKLTSLVSPIANFLPYIVVILGLVICLFGKKMEGVIKFIIFFLLGFVLGIHFLAPVIPPEVPIPEWVVGLVVAIIAAVLYKFLYVVVYSAFVLYPVYRLCYYGFFIIEEPIFTTGKALASLAVAAIVLVISFLLFKFVDMLLTSALGALIAVSAFSAWIYDLGAISAFGQKSWIFELCVMGVITLAGFAVQVKTRRRY